MQVCAWKILNTPYLKAVMLWSSLPVDILCQLFFWLWDMYFLCARLTLTVQCGYAVTPVEKHHLTTNERPDGGPAVDPLPKDKHGKKLGYFPLLSNRVDVRYLTDIKLLFLGPQAHLLVCNSLAMLWKWVQEGFKILICGENGIKSMLCWFLEGLLLFSKDWS